MPTCDERMPCAAPLSGKKRAAAVMDLGDERRAFVRYVWDGTLEGLALALDLAERKGETTVVLQAIGLYYGDLNKLAQRKEARRKKG